jgi:hypothetical protein
MEEKTVENKNNLSFTQMKQSSLYKSDKSLELYNLRNKIKLQIMNWDDDSQRRISLHTDLKAYQCHRTENNREIVSRVNKSKDC